MRFINKSDRGLVLGRFTRQPGEFTLKPPISEMVQAQIDHFTAKGMLEEVTKKATPKPDPKPAPKVEPPPAKVEPKKVEQKPAVDETKQEAPAPVKAGAKKPAKKKATKKVEPNKTAGADTDKKDKDTNN